MLAIREQSWLFPSDFPLRDMQNTVKCPCIEILYHTGPHMGHSVIRYLNRHVAVIIPHYLPYTCLQKLLWRSIIRELIKERGLINIVIISASQFLVVSFWSYTYKSIFMSYTFQCATMCSRAYFMQTLPQYQYLLGNRPTSEHFSIRVGSLALGLGFMIMVRVTF